MDFLKLNAARTPDRIAIQLFDGDALTFAQLDMRCDAIAMALRQSGLCERERIGLLTDNDAATIALWWGARRAGLYYVPLSTRLAPDELAYMLADCEARALISSTAHEMLARQAADQVVVHGGTPPVLIPASLDAIVGQFGLPAPSPRHFGREIVYSSGTTGRPKGIQRTLLPVENGLDVAPFEGRLRHHLEIDDRIIFLISSPLYHSMGRFANRVIEAGGTLVVLPAFDPRKALMAIARYGVTHSLWVPTMFNRLLAIPEAERAEFDLSSHRFAVHAAAPCPVPVKRAMIEWWGPIIHEFYGGSENAGVTFIRAEEWLARPGSVGRPIAGSLAILDEESGSHRLPSGQIGRICFAGGVPYSYIGTHAAPEQGSAGLTGYGDSGWVDDDGFLFLSDRRSDLIIVGGVNIWPAEVERVLMEHSAIAQVAVIGIPHPDFGQEVKAIVVLRDAIVGDCALEQSILDFGRGRIASIKLPRSVAFLPDLPRNENGKLLKRLLRDRFGADGAILPPALPTTG